VVELTSSFCYVFFLCCWCCGCFCFGGWGGGGGGAVVKLCTDLSLTPSRYRHLVLGLSRSTIDSANRQHIWRRHASTPKERVRAMHENATITVSELAKLQSCRSACRPKRALSSCSTRSPRAIAVLAGGLRYIQPVDLPVLR